MRIVCGMRTNDTLIMFNRGFVTWVIRGRRSVELGSGLIRVTDLAVTWQHMCQKLTDSHKDHGDLRLCKV